MRANHAINNIYKLISFFNYYLLFFLKLSSDQTIMIVIHNDFLFAMHGFRDNDVILPTGHDVIVSPPPWGASRDVS